MVLEVLVHEDLGFVGVWIKRVKRGRGSVLAPALNGSALDA